MKLRICLLAACGSLLIAPDAMAASCGTSSTINGITIKQIDGALLFKTRKLQVDADGAPNSYLVNGKGLSATCDGMNAIVDGHKVGPPTPGWCQLANDALAKAKQTGDYSKISFFGFLADQRTNKPLIQKDDDPLPGTAYITSTFVAVPGTPDRTQRHFIDAVKIPYVVLPRAFTEAFGLGSSPVLSVVYRVRTDKQALGVFGDRGGFGEASLRLHQDLNHNPLSNKNGVERANIGIENEDIVTVVFPGKSAPATLDDAKWRDDIASEGAAVFTQWGGIERLKACANL